jgi:hypothetical protein
MDTGEYVVYFATRCRATGKLCVGAAASKAVTGPFEDVLGHALIESAPSDCFVRWLSCTRAASVCCDGGRSSSRASVACAG